MKLALATCLALAALTGTAAAVPTTMSFTARLTDGTTPVEGAVNLHVAVFDAATDGTLVWEETHTALEATRGLVYANLGSVEPVANGLDASVFGGTPMFIELTVDGDVLSPRIPIASVPYAVKAGVAEALEGFDPSTTQLRVGGTCAAGSSIRQINADGTVVCQLDIAGTGDITGVTTAAGSGLAGGAATGNVTLTVDTATIQARVTGVCPAGNYVASVNANGSVNCSADAVGGSGDITDITTPAVGGLTGGVASGGATLSIATGGVGTAQIAAGAVTMSKTNTPMGYAALVSSNGSGSVFGAPTTFTENGSCLVTAEAFNSSSNSAFRVRPAMLRPDNSVLAQPDFGFAAFASDGANTNGYFASATAVLTTNQLGVWQFGCDMPNFGSTLSCRVSWLCN